MTRAGALLISGLLLLLAGCPPSSEVKPTQATLQADTLPSEPPSLLRISDEQFDQGGVGVRNAQVALERALQKNPDWASSKPGYEGQWRLARVYAELCDPEEVAQCAALVPQGLQAARKAVELEPGNLEGHYYLAQLLGYAALLQKGNTEPLVQQIKAEGEQAAKIDDRYDRGGPLRLLGTLHARAPAPPISVGDPEKAVQYLQRAVAVDGTYPPNTIYLAEALVADERYQEADAAIQKARQLLDDPRWSAKRASWKTLLAKAERKLRAKQP